MQARVISGILTVVLAFAGIAAAQGGGDQYLADRIASSIRSYPQFTIFDDVSGYVDGGVAVLTGKVTMPYKKTDIERRVARIDGVREVRSDISVLPVSIYDDDLRRRAARAIYGSPAFWTYAAMAHPPIHIIVEHGRIRLTGTVNSNVERVLARSLATGLGELAVINELKTER